MTDCATDKPELIAIDFSALTFVRPAGVTFLSNFVSWLVYNDIEVTFQGFDSFSAPIAYWDNSLFFQIHSGKKIKAFSAPKGTTLPLVSVPYARSHQWMRNTLIPWLVDAADTNKASLYQIHNAVAEMFNNTKDHSTKEIASIFCQHYPNERNIYISIADFGVGIPKVVRRVRPDLLNDDKAIMQAVKRGFTSGTTKGNAGLGLDDLLNAVVAVNQGRVDILSLNGHIQFRPNGNGGVKVQTSGSVGFCPGTTIDICIKTNTIVHVPEEPEDLEW